MDSIPAQTWRDRFLPSLPLLAKELQELSARRRTYIVRVAYVALFCLLSMLIIVPELAGRGSNPLNILGVGRELMLVIFVWQFAGVYVFLPGMMSGVLTSEKERNSLGLLFLTRLGPWAILFEKLLGRVVPMLLFIACSLPLIMLCVSLGGTDTWGIFNGVYFLTLTVLQVGCISLACSAYFRTTIAAFFATYACMFCLFFGLAITDSLLFRSQLQQSIPLLLRELGWVGPNQWVSSELFLFPFLGFLQFIYQAENVGRAFAGTASYQFAILMGLPTLFSALTALVLARIFIVRRAFVAPWNPLMALLRRLDSTFHALNQRLAAGITLSKPADEIPETHPITWRETQKRSLGQTRYLFRMLLGLIIPTVLVSTLTIWNDAIDAAPYQYQQPGSITMVVILEWIAVALLITASSATVISGERGHQTFEILMSTPLSSRQILDEKLSGVKRLVFVCSIPLIIAICFEAWARDIAGPQTWGYNRHYLWWHYLPTAISLVVIYLPLLSWLSFWIGLKFHSASKAVLAALIVIFAWCVLPILGIVFFWEVVLRSFQVYVNLEQSGYAMILLLSPFGLLLFTEFDSLNSLHDVIFVPLIANVVLYGTILLLIRRYVLKNAAKLLGRTQEDQFHRQPSNSAASEYPATALS